MRELLSIVLIPIALIAALLFVHLPRAIGPELADTGTAQAANAPDTQPFESRIRAPRGPIFAPQNRPALLIIPAPRPLCLVVDPHAAMCCGLTPPIVEM